MADLKGVVSASPSGFAGSSSARRFREEERVEVEERVVGAVGEELVLAAAAAPASLPSGLSAAARGLLGRGRNGAALFLLPGAPPRRLGSLADVAAAFLPLALDGVALAGESSRGISLVSFAFLVEEGAAGGLEAGFFFEDEAAAVALGFFCGVFVFDGVAGDVGDFRAILFAAAGTTNLINACAMREGHD